MLATFSRLLGVLTAALAGIAAVSLTVAGVGIMNVMLVSVSERTREVGLLKALGATSGQVLRLFLAEAATLSAVGGAVGLVMAWAASATVRHVYPSFPMQPPPWAMPAALVVSLGVGLLFGAWPARRAARLDPILAMTRR
jgi:putative ABC transport system permease protein